MATSWWSERRRVGAALVVAALTTVLAAPGWAHSGGRVQLFVDHLELHPTGGDGWAVSAALVDADSGTPAPGFDVVVDAADAAGRTSGPVTLTDAGTGEYSGVLTAAPGKWRLAVRADTLPGGTPGVPLRKAYPLVLEPGRAVAIGADRPSGPGPAVSLASAAATAIVMAWFVVRRRRRHGLRPAAAPTVNA